MDKRSPIQLHNPTYGSSALSLIPINGRVVRLVNYLGQTKPIYNENDEIESLSISINGGNIYLSVGSTIRPKEGANPYKINHIFPLYNADNILVGYELCVAKLTKASIFVAPLLGGNRKLFLWDKYFVNAFIGARDHRDVICLLYRYSGDQLFTKFEAALEKFGTFKCKFDPDPYHVMFVFEIPEEFQSAYDMFKESKYSQISDFVKLKILDYHNFSQDGMTGQILFKAHSLKMQLEKDLELELPAEAELCSAINLEEEIFNEQFYFTSKPII